MKFSVLLARRLRLLDLDDLFLLGDASGGIGEGTAPETFRFESNHWLAEDRPQASKPKLPVEEKAGVYGQMPNR